MFKNIIAEESHDVQECQECQDVHIGESLSAAASDMTRGMRGMWAEAIMNKVSEGPW